MSGELDEIPEYVYSGQLGTREIYCTGSHEEEDLVEGACPSCEAAV